MSYEIIWKLPSNSRNGKLADIRIAKAPNNRGKYWNIKKRFKTNTVNNIHYISYKFRSAQFQATQDTVITVENFGL